MEVINAEACPDHIHMYVSIPPKLSVSSFMGYLKGKSTLIIFERHANLKYKYSNRTFWCRGFYVSTVGNNKSVVYNYVRAHHRSATTIYNGCAETIEKVVHKFFVSMCVRIQFLLL